MMHILIILLLFSFSAPGGHFSCCFFTFTADEQDLFTVERSELSVFVRPSLTQSSRAILELTAYTYELVESVAHLRRERTPQLKRKIMVNLEGRPRAGFWERIDITNIVQGWFVGYHHNMGLHIGTKERWNGVFVTNSSEVDYVSKHVNYEIGSFK